MGLDRTLFESREPLIRSHEDVMMAMARAEDLMRKGERSPDLTIAEDLAAAAHMLIILEERKLTVDQYLSQGQMFERELTPFQERLLKHFEGIVKQHLDGIALGDLAMEAMEAKADPIFDDLAFLLVYDAMEQFLGDYADAVIASPHPQQAAMFSGQQLTKEGLFDATVRRQAEGPLFACQASPKVKLFPRRPPEPMSPDWPAAAPRIPEAEVAPVERPIAAEAAPQPSEEALTHLLRRQAHKGMGRWLRKW